MPKRGMNRNILVEVVSSGKYIALFALLILASCLPPQQPESFICNPPYIQVGAECCLDQNKNSICDGDDADNTGDAAATIAGGIEPGAAEITDSEGPTRRTETIVSRATEPEAAEQGIIDVPVAEISGDEAPLEQPEIVSNFVARWNPLRERKIQFTWAHNEQAEQYYVALDMWNTYNTGPLGSIEDTIADLQGRREFGMPSHVYEYQNDQGELYWGWNPDFEFLPSLGTFRIHAYLLDAGYNLVEEVAYVQFVVNDFADEATSTGVGSAPEVVTPETTPEFGVAECSDGLDNDRDGVIDGRDSQCRGVTCSVGSFWAWTYLRTGSGTFLEDESRAPARVGCIFETGQCMNIQGERVDRNIFYTNKWICGEGSNGGGHFYRCESADIGAIVGDFTCRLVSGTYKWTLNVNENTQALCNDNSDNDNDGSVDELDTDCVDVQCNVNADSQWTWSWLISAAGDQIEDFSRRPARIGCCLSNECINSAGACIRQNTFYTNKWVCGSSNECHPYYGTGCQSWFRCSETSDVGIRRGDYRCTVFDGVYGWQRVI
ncbi:MAG TPA: hypothetical protein VJH88_03485 [Candidatus Nanoarchaeia archaeon]|nr:hypothetical protein [Candidatus Nanoarchaeia archaeon]